MCEEIGGIMQRIKERLLSIGFENDETVVQDQYIVINNNDYEKVSNINRNYDVIVLINANLSSHFMNIVRKKLRKDNCKFLIGGDILFKLLDGKERFLIQADKNAIIVEGIEFYFQSFDSYENLKYDIAVNLNDQSYCIRPDKQYGEEYLKLMEKGFQNFHGRICFINNKQIWYKNGLYPSELYDWCDCNFDEYLSELRSALRVFHEMLSSENISNSAASELVCDYYKYTDYIGVLADVVNYKIWQSQTSERIFKLQSYSSNQFIISDTKEKGLKVLTSLSNALKSESSLQDYYQTLCKLELSRIEYWYILLNVLSDLRRKSMIFLRVHNSYIQSIS